MQLTLRDKESYTLVEPQQDAQPQPDDQPQPDSQQNNKINLQVDYVGTYLQLCEERKNKIESLFENKAHSNKIETKDLLAYWIYYSFDEENECIGQQVDEPIADRRFKLLKKVWDNELLHINLNACAARRLIEQKFSMGMGMYIILRLSQSRPGMFTVTCDVNFTEEKHKQIDPPRQKSDVKVENRRFDINDKGIVGFYNVVTDDLDNFLQNIHFFIYGNAMRSTRIVDKYIKTEPTHF